MYTINGMINFWPFNFVFSFNMQTIVFIFSGLSSSFFKNRKSLIISKIYGTPFKHSLTISYGSTFASVFVNSGSLNLFNSE